jgi:hypothetical protein
MQTVSTNMTVVDYCAALKRRDIVVNKDYQRNDQVWPDSAKTYLIETIILGYPLPKIYLYQITDIKSRKTVKEIVDGQQRSTAIYDFFNDSFAVSKAAETESLHGRKCSELDEEQQQAFFSFSLSFDLLVGATKENIVEVFRRMNSYTVPLNAEEHRHASYQGRFKWFANRLGKRYNGVFREIGLFSEKQLLRMADTKLLTEVCDALLNGVRTTNRRILDRLYKDRDKAFPEEKIIERSLGEALDCSSAWSEIHGSNLMRPHIVYSLIIAIVNQRKSFEALSKLKLPKGTIGPRKRVVLNLSQLADALNYDLEEAPSEYKEFVAACASKTNVKDQRITRIKWLSRALISDEL